MIYLTTNIFKSMYNLYGKALGFHSMKSFYTVVIIVILAVVAFYAIRSAIYFFVIRPRDPELYHEYRADRRASQISNAIDRNTRSRNQIYDSSMSNQIYDNNIHNHDINNFLWGI